MSAVTFITIVTFEDELNHWEEQGARFDLRSKKVEAREDLWKVERFANREIILHIPVPWITQV